METNVGNVIVDVDARASASRNANSTMTIQRANRIVADPKVRLALKKMDEITDYHARRSNEARESHGLADKKPPEQPEYDERNQGDARVDMAKNPIEPPSRIGSHDQDQRASEKDAWPRPKPHTFASSSLGQSPPPQW